MNTAIELTTPELLRYRDELTPRAELELEAGLMLLGVQALLMARDGEWPVHQRVARQALRFAGTPLPETD